MYRDRQRQTRTDINIQRQTEINRQRQTETDRRTLIDRNKQKPETQREKYRDRQTEVTYRHIELCNSLSEGYCRPIRID